MIGGTNETSGVIIQAYGTVYTGGDVKVIIMGRILVGIDAVKYGSKQEKKNVMAMSREPVNRLRGGKTYEASLTLKAYEVDALEVTANGGIEGLQPFAVTVVYSDPLEQVIKTDTLNFAEFTGASREIKGPDNEVILECELIIGGIQRG